MQSLIKLLECFIIPICEASVEAVAEQMDLFPTVADMSLTFLNLGDAEHAAKWRYGHFVVTFEA